MRALALAAIAAFVFAGAADARPWTDPNGRVTFDSPAGWTVQPDARPTQLTYVITAIGNAECHVVGQPNGNASIPPARVRAAGAEDTRFDAATWTRILNGLFPEVFPNASAQVTATSKDTTGFWPIQTATVTAGDQTVHAAMQIRPGFDLIAVCMTFAGPDQIDRFNTFFHSIGNPHDAEWQAAAASAAPAATTPAPAPAPAAH